MENVVEEYKRAEVESHERFAREGGFHLRKPFDPEFGSDYWVKWAAISMALDRLGIRPGAQVLDLGCGAGWTTLFLAESGFQATGVDIAPAAIEMARSRAERWGAEARFEVADMEELALGERFDAVLVFDALHHSPRQQDVVHRIGEHLGHEAWALFGEPSWLHLISPSARRTSRVEGWVERGITARRLRRDCRRSGLTEFRRFFEGTRPYERGWELLWETARLLSARVAVAPQASIWLAARRPDS